MTLITYACSYQNHNDGSLSLDMRVAGLTADECEVLRSKLMKEIEMLQNAKDAAELLEECIANVGDKNPPSATTNQEAER